MLDNISEENDAHQRQNTVVISSVDLKEDEKLDMEQQEIMIQKQAAIKKLKNIIKDIHPNEVLSEISYNKWKPFTPNGQRRESPKRQLDRLVQQSNDPRELLQMSNKRMAFLQERFDNKLSHLDKLKKVSLSFDFF